MVKPVMELVKTPVPVPSDVFVDKAIVGFIDVDQTTPLFVTEAPPSDVTLPPDAAVVVVIDDITDVVTVGVDVDDVVVNVTSVPYEVPIAFVA